MKLDKGTSSLVIGLALFAMFFGSGNLIYPLFVGQFAKDQWMMMGSGFLLTAVLMPFLGVVAMVAYEGCYASFFNTIGRVPGFIFRTFLLTIWIPLGSAPRCMTLAFASMKSYFAYMPPLWMFSLIYSALVFVIVVKKLGILDILGKWITPLLLGSIACVFYQGFTSFSTPSGVQEVKDGLFFSGIIEGYNTMDLIASFFFSASVIHIINSSGSTMKQTLKLVVRSSVIGIVVLAGVYVSLIAVSARHAGLLEGIPKDEALAYLAQVLMGPAWSFAAILAILLACFSTSIALILVYTDYLHDEVLKKTQHPILSVIIALAITYVMSLFGLEGITMVTAPVFKICYPLLICLIVWNVCGKLFFQKKDNEQVYSNN